MVKAKGSLRPLLLLLKLLLLLVLLSCYLEPGWVTASVAGSSPPPASFDAPPETDSFTPQGHWFTHLTSEHESFGGSRPYV